MGFGVTLCEWPDMTVVDLDRMLEGVTDDEIELVADHLGITRDEIAADCEFHPAPDLTEEERQTVEKEQDRIIEVTFRSTIKARIRQAFTNLAGDVWDDVTDIAICGQRHLVAGLDLNFDDGGGHQDVQTLSLSVLRPAMIGTSSWTKNKLVPAADLCDDGHLQEVNRLFFHPRGMALMTWEQDEGSPGSSGVVGVLDYRHDPEGVYFLEVSREKHRKDAALLKSKASTRVGNLGYVRQPVPAETSPEGGGDGNEEG
jgi:hypothetical protein